MSAEQQRSPAARTLMKLGASSRIVNSSAPSGATLCSAPRLLSRADGKEVVLGDRTDIASLESEQRLRPPGSSHKLDLDSVGRVELGNRTEIARSEAVFGQVMRQDDSV
jgi:hypothetical protein